MAWLVQVKFDLDERTTAAAPDGWVTTGLAEDMRAAARAAAFVYRDCKHPESGATPLQLRIRQDEQIAAVDGADALAEASRSLRAFGELLAA